MAQLQHKQIPQRHLSDEIIAVDDDDEGAPATAGQGGNLSNAASGTITNEHSSGHGLALSIEDSDAYRLSRQFSSASTSNGLAASAASAEVQLGQPQSPDCSGGGALTSAAGTGVAPLGDTLSQDDGGDLQGAEDAATLPGSAGSSLELDHILSAAAAGGATQQGQQSEHEEPPRFPNVQLTDSEEQFIMG